MNMLFTKKISIIATSIATTILLSACASNAPTQSLAIQKPNNQYEVTAVGKTSLTAKNNAIMAANNTCGKNATPIIVDEKSGYNGALKGVFDEKTGQTTYKMKPTIGKDGKVYELITDPLTGSMRKRKI